MKLKISFLHVPFKKFKKAVKPFLLINVLVLALGVQTAQAYDVPFHSSNDIFWYNPDACKVGNGDVTLQGTTAEMIWTYLINKGLTPEQAAGVMGNIKQESSYSPTRHQSTADVWTSDSGRAWGIIQWDSGRRYTPNGPDHKSGGGILGKLASEKPQLEKYVDIQYDTIRNKDAESKFEPGHLAELMQFELDYLYQESNSRQAKASYGGGNEWEGLKRQKTIEEALVYWHDNAERSSDTPAEVINNRGKFAKEAYDNFKGLTTTRPSDSGAGSATSGGAKPTIFLDPGHGAAISQYVDQSTGLADRETDNGQESQDVLDVANRIKAELEKTGYTVVLARSDNTTQVSKRARVDAAVAAKAQLAVSLHTDTSLNQVWAQKVGTSRSYNGKTVTFTNEANAKKSQDVANAMAATRSAAEGDKVTTDPDNTQQASSFGRGDVPSKGNISLVQLWGSEVPWVYNEISRDVGKTGLSEARKNAYTKGVVDAIKQTIKGGESDGTCANNKSFAGGNLADTTKAYAWPTYKGLTIAATTAWQDASQKARSEGRYIGGIQHPGIDCGGFVTTLLVDSGFAPNYNYGGKLSAGAGATPTQRAWADANWENLGPGSKINVADLQPGDVAHLPGHTFVFVGNIDGFESNIASASLDERAPMAGKESLTAGNTTWYRQKAPTSPSGAVKAQ